MSNIYNKKSTDVWYEGDVSHEFKDFLLDEQEIFFDIDHPEMAEVKQKKSTTFDFAGFFAKDSLSQALLHGKGFVQFRIMTNAYMKRHGTNFTDAMSNINKNQSHLIRTVLPKLKAIAKDLQDGEISPDEAMSKIEDLPVTCYFFPLTLEIIRQIQNGGVTRTRQREEDEELSLD